MGTLERKKPNVKITQPVLDVRANGCQVVTLSGAALGPGRRLFLEGRRSKVLESGEVLWCLVAPCWTGSRVLGKLDLFPQISGED